MRKKWVLYVSITLLLFLILPFVHEPKSSVSASDTSDDWPMFQHDLNHTGYSSSKAPNNNEISWIYETGRSIRTSPAVVGGVVFIGSDDRNLYALNATTGRLIWKYETGGVIESSPCINDGKIFISSSEGKVYALDSMTGEYIWSIESWRLGHSSPAVSDGKVFMGASDYSLHTFDEDTGIEIWNFTARAPSRPIYGQYTNL